MAESKRNVITHGLSGKVGNLIVFSQRHGKTIVSMTPLITGEASSAQIGVQTKFRLASIYAKAVMNDPDKKLAYEQKAAPGQSAFNLALADYFNAPEILAFETNAYTGAAGNMITAQVADDFKVKAVEVTITGANGIEIEKGNAVQEPDGLNWTYTATQPNSAIAGTIITLSAKDTPGNVTVAEKVLP